MRRRMLVSIVAALVLAAVPSTALMATVTRDNVCGAANGLVSLGYTYDDVTNQVQTFVITNNGAQGTLIGELLDNNGNVLASVRRNINDSQTQRTFNVRNLNIQLVQVTGPRGTSLQFPGIIACEFIAGR